MPRSEFDILNALYPEDANAGVALASAARTTAINSPDLINGSARGVRVYINVTADPATASLTFTIKDKDPISGTYHTILASAAITGVGLTVLTVYPGMTTAANVAVSEPLPRTWRVEVTVGNADSMTYSVSYVYLN